HPPPQGHPAADRIFALSSRPAYTRPIRPHPTSSTPVDETWLRAQSKINIKMHSGGLRGCYISPHRPPALLRRCQTGVCCTVASPICFLISTRTKNYIYLPA